MITGNVINHRDLYRLPWSLPDNAISWLEPIGLGNVTRMFASINPPEQYHAAT